MASGAPGAAGQAFLRPLRAWVRMAALPPKRRPAVVDFKWKILRGDTVMIRAGRDAGKSGRVKRVHRRSCRVIVEALNTVKRAVRPVEGGAPGGIVSVESPIHYSNVGLIDPVDGRPCRAGIRWAEDGKRVRVSKRSGSVIPWPKIEDAYTRPFRPTEAGPKDTPADAVSRQTYQPPPHLLPFLSAPGSAAATKPELVAARPRSGTVSLFRTRKAAHGDKIPALLHMELPRRHRLRADKLAAKRADAELERQMRERAARAAVPSSALGAAAASTSAARAEAPLR